MNQADYERALSVRGQLDRVEVAAAVNGVAAGQNARWRAKQKLSADVQALLAAAEEEDAIRAEVKAMSHSSSGARIRQEIAAERYRASLLSKDRLAPSSSRETTGHADTQPSTQPRGTTAGSSIAAAISQGSALPVSPNYTKGFAAGTQRVLAVMQSEHFEGRAEQAVKLLGNAKLSADEIVSMLADMPPGGAAACRQMLAAIGFRNPNLGTGGSDLPAYGDAQAVWDKAIASVSGATK